MTVEKIIKRALRLLGVYQSGENLPSSEFVDAVEALNALLGSWNNQRLLGPANARVTKVLAAGTVSYNVGTSQAINTPRPVRIDKAFVRDSNGNDIPLMQIGKTEYNEIMDKDLQSSEPGYFFYDATLPHGHIYLYPAPGAGYTLYLDIYYQFTTYSNPSDIVTLQDGMEEALVYNLAIRLATEWGKVASQEVRMIANETLRNIKRTNSYDIPLMKTFYSGDFEIARGF